jgi:hypothetical protein
MDTEMRYAGRRDGGSQPLRFMISFVSGPRAAFLGASRAGQIWQTRRIPHRSEYALGTDVISQRWRNHGGGKGLFKAICHMKGKKTESEATAKQSGDVQCGLDPTQYSVSLWQLHVAYQPRR